MACRDRAILEQGMHRLRQFQKPQRVSDMAAALADDPGEIRLRVAVLGRELLISKRLFDRVEIAPLNVFDDGDLERLACRRPRR